MSEYDLYALCNYVNCIEFYHFDKYAKNTIRTAL